MTPPPPKPESPYRALLKQLGFFALPFLFPIIGIPATLVLIGLSVALRPCSPSGAAAASAANSSSPSTATPRSPIPSSTANSGSAKPPCSYSNPSATPAFVEHPSDTTERWNYSPKKKGLFKLTVTLDHRAVTAWNGKR